MGSFMGAVLTFTAFYLLELLKKESEPKPQLKLRFSKKDEPELLVESKPHYIYVPRLNNHREAGEAKYLRIKVVNSGDKMATGCIGVVKSIEVESVLNGKLSKRLAPGWDGPMTLLWPYEQKQDYRSSSTALIPIGASDFLDILVAYDDALMPVDQNHQSSTRKWFLKLKTQPQPQKHRELITIERDSKITYYFMLEVYAEGCSPASITLILEHPATSEIIEVYPLDNISEKITFKLCSGSAMPTQPASREEKEELYDLL